MEPKIYHVEINIVERTDSKPDHRFFDGLLSGCKNVLGEDKVGMCSHDAIAWCNSVEARAFRWNNTPKFDYETGEPSDAQIIIHRMPVKELAI